jgi:protein involved in polysaccharide export with SLBB domain
LAAVLIFGSFTSISQQVDPKSVSNDQLLQYYQQAKASGLSDMQIEQAAMAKGYTLSDLSQLRQRLTQAQNPASTSGSKRDTVEVTRQQEPVPASPITKPTTSVQPEKPTIFGSKFFNDAFITFEPNLRLATPKDYILGPDDELLVDIYGNAVDNLRLKVSPDGTVKMINLAPLYINGLTIEQASERIISRLRQAYSGLNLPGSSTKATITLSGVRSIKVMITGSVNRPGTYTVSSLATAFNALYLSGGPNEIGSFRKIEVIRNNNVIRKIDIYSFLVNADLKDNVSLRDQDIILIYPYETRVTLNGEMKYTGRFELKPGETFKDLLYYAGGFTEEAYTASINYQRNTGKELRVGAINPEDFGTFNPKSGDVFTVGKTLDRFENRVEIQGAVYRPGNYALDESVKTIKNLILKAEGLRGNAFLNRALISREQENLEPLLISFDLGKLMRGEIADIPLKRQDEITIKTVQEMRESYTVTISGAVQNPGSFAYRDSMSVSDLIYMAGGYTEAAIPYRVEVARRVKEDTLGLPSSQNVVIYTFDVDKSLKKLDENRIFRLKPFDIIFVRTSPRYEAQRTVTIQGEVLYPGTYSIVDKNDRISDLIQRAGGLKPEAYLATARFTRNDQLIGIDLEKIIEKSEILGNLHLLGGDVIQIPRITELVSISGQILNPSIVNYDPSFRFKDYISEAGGFTDKARRRRIYVTYANGRVDRTRKVFGFDVHPKIERGATITVPAKEVKENRPETSPAERAAIISVLGTLIITMIRLF